QALALRPQGVLAVLLQHRDGVREGSQDPYDALAGTGRVRAEEGVWIVTRAAEQGVAVVGGQGFGLRGRGRGGQGAGMPAESFTASLHSSHPATYGRVTGGGRRGPPGRRAGGPARPAPPPRPGSMSARRREQMVEFARLRLPDQRAELLHGHLHALAEVVGEHDPAGLIGLRIEEELGAAAAAVAAEHLDGAQFRVSRTDEGGGGDGGGGGGGGN